MGMKDLRVEREKYRNVAATARGKARELTHQIRQETNDFIVSAMERFVEAMGRSYEKDSYIEMGNAYSDDFTKFVSRNYKIGYWGGHTEGVTDKHTEAINEYTKAWEHMNRVFVEELVSLTPEDRRRIAWRWCLKNTGKLKV